MKGVYRNLHNGKWSATNVTPTMNRAPGVEHHEAIALSDCTFVMKHSRRCAVRKAFETTGKRAKEVHAYVVGTPCAMPQGVKLTRIFYDPYTDDCFHVGDGKPLSKADCVVFTDHAYLVSK